ncbi:hypothetical protein CQW23_22845 [Capsicum baccatum]|uniref:Uncharacterized protein n=1 Tax=Capsicum baccatum TaxID=33114 RepID=A0A2G2W217_CAPBA|nr:hypothetical protein CQW23_22845 [Capsicum baccatum]
MMYNGKSRHIRRRHNTIRELLSSGIITIDYVKSKDNVSDPLTKGLSREGVERTSKGMGLRPRTSQHGDDYRNGNMKIVDDIMERYRDGKIPIEKFHISDSIFRTEDFHLIGKWLDIALQNGVKDLVFERIHRYQNGVNDLSFARVHRYQLYPVPIFKILAAKSLRELVLSDCDLMHVSLSSGVVNCHSLRKLSLINTHLVGNMLQNLFNSCPLRELVLSDCDLMHVSLSSGVVNCHSLRKLSLINTHLDGNMLQNLLNSCPLIVTYIQEYCSGLEKIELLNLQKIKSVSIKTRGGQSCLLKSKHQLLNTCLIMNLSSRSQSLKVLKIKWCRDVPTELVVSNLVSLEYMGYQIPELKTAGKSSQLKHSKIAFHCYDILNTAWFFKLRKFLSNSVSWSQISLYFCVCNEINMEDLQLDHVGPNPKVDIFNVNIHLLRKECPSFVDALIWSC